MIHGIHMIVYCVLTEELVAASFTFKLWGTMAQCIHVLVAGPLTAKKVVASVALSPMIIVIHMLIAIFPIIEGIGAGRTFVHVGQNWRSVGNEKRLGRWC